MNNNFDNFFPVIKNKESDFKYRKVVRGKKKRKKLEGYSCNECEGFWEAVKDIVSEKEMKKYSRHRYGKEGPPKDANDAYYDFEWFKDD